MMEKYLSRIAALLHTYHTSVEDLQLSREKKEQEEAADLSKREAIYMKKLRIIRKQFKYPISC